MTRLICHIGFEKTGSTSIQSFLNQAPNNDDLPWFYPETGKVYDHHFEIAKLQPDVETLRERLAIEAKGAELVVLSSEHFSLCKDQGLIDEYAKVFAPFDSEIVMYLRDPLDWLRSLYGEYIKWGGHVPIRRFYQVQDWQFNYTRQIKKWVSTFGRENVSVFNYTGIGNVVDHFRSEVLKDNTHKPHASAFKNRSDSLVLLELLRKLNSAMPSISTKAMRQAILDRIGEAQVQLPEYHWPIGKMITESLEQQRDRLNNYLGYSFFETGAYKVVPKNEEAERQLDLMLAEVLQLFSKEDDSAPENDQNLPVDLPG
jgi:hypothetical protein